MSKYFWYMAAGESRVWHEALAIHRYKVIAEIKPAFITALDASDVPDEESWGKEDYAKLKFTGPFYLDWDSEDIAEAAKALQSFLKNLGDVDLTSLRLYASGGKGFHCEIPEEVFNPKPSKAGVTLLPYVYKEMALELVTNCMDMRVYTARKGRMWRCPGVLRPNGKYKVPITLDEALAMTPELYDELTSVPRMEPLRTPPKLSITLSTLYVKSLEKSDRIQKHRGKSKGDAQLLARFSGEFPPTLQRIMAGEGVMPGIGFHKIAMQLAITARALGKSSEDLVLMSEGLVHSHQSDSSRYNTPRLRKEELRRLWDYADGADAYDFSIGGIRSICAAGVDTSDLNSPLENAAAGMVPDDDEEVPEELTVDLESSEHTLLEGLVMLRKGVFKRTAEGAKNISNISFSKPNKMLDAEDGLHIGLEVDVYADGILKGRQLMGLDAFKSRVSLNAFCQGRGGIFSGSDTQASALQLILNRKAEKDGKMTHIIRKEGIDVIIDPTYKEGSRKHTVWVSPEGVLGHTDGVQYRYQPKVSSGVIFNTDLHLSETIADTDEARTWLNALFTMNSPTVVGQMLGWFVSCFHKQFYNIGYNQFPLLHPNGAAGSGKTHTTSLLCYMFYMNSPIQTMSASHNASTNFGLKAAWTASASIPVVIDEYKPAELASARYDFLLQHFRMLYNQAQGSSGGINRGGAESSFRDITSYTYSAPTVYIGESQEMQTAIVQRTVSVGFSAAESKKHTPSFDIAFAESNRHYLPKLGNLLMRESLAETVESRVAALDPIRKGLRATMNPSTHDRQVYNTAVVIAGVDFLGDSLSKVFGDEFLPHITGLRNAILDNKDDLNTFAMAESSKVLNDMAMISRTEDSASDLSMREGHEYLIGEGWIEFLIRESYVKYFAWCNRKGFKPMYSTVDGFIGSVGKSPALVDSNCFDSKLRGQSTSKVFRFSLEKLAAEGVEMFKSKPLD